MPKVDRVSDLRQLEARRICIIKPSALGDVVQTLPLLPALRRRFPAARLSWVVNRDYAGLLEGHPDLHEVLPFDRRGGFRDYLRLLFALRQRRFDLVLDMQGLLRTAVMTWATGAKVRVGLETAREGAGRACNAIVSGTGRMRPAFERYQQVIAALGAKSLPGESGLSIDRADRELATQTLAGMRTPIVAIHAGAGWPTKRWPASQFALVARQFPGSVVTVGSRGEIPLANEIELAVRAAGGQVRNLAGATTLGQLAALLEAADIVLSNDSGPMHLAAAVGTPVVGVFTCTSPVISGPAGAGHVLVAAEIPCAASYCKRCPHSGALHQACFADITVERVARAVDRALARRVPARVGLRSA